MGTDHTTPAPEDFVALDALSRGQAALARGAWAPAQAAFEAALAARESPEALEGLADAAWWLADKALTFPARERAFRLYRDTNNQRGAARLATALANDYFAFKGEYAIAHGWRQRAHRLLEGLEPCRESGWLAISEAHCALEADHAPAVAQLWSAQAVGLGRALGELNLEMLALAYEGFALVHQGRVADGMRRLDEATLAAVSGEMTDLDATCMACACLVYACERTRDLERAAQWCTHLEALATRWAHPLHQAMCRAHFAGLLLWQGQWSEAEAALLSALPALQAGFSAQAAEVLLRLADLRCRQGQLEEAERLLAQAETGAHKLLAGEPALLVRAALALEHDAPETAAALADRYLRTLPLEDRMRQVAALELLVQALVALGEISRASNALVELSAIAAGLATRTMRASAVYAAGLLFAAQNNRDSARACFEDAVDLYTRGGAPFEAARARVQLARTLAALGRHAEAAEQTRAALTVLRALGAGREAERATTLLRRLEGPPAGRDGRGSLLTKRELQVLRLIARGLSNKEIAQQLIVSEHTVHRHVANIFTKLNLPSRAAAATYAAQHYLL